MEVLLVRLALYVTLLLALAMFGGAQAQADELLATYYGGIDNYCGAITASGEVFDCSAYTAASNVYPLGTVVQVCYEGCTVVRINDRCGACGVDLSPAAAEETGILAGGPGLAEVTVL